MPRVSIAPEADLNTDINVLPLIDVLLVLIIVFFLLERDHIFIPAQVPPPEAEAGPPTGGQIVLDLKADGGMAINGQPIPTDRLAAQLEAIYQNRPQKLLFLHVAPNRVYQEAITAMDVARGAGVEVLAWVPEPSSPRR
jgi:biopolymer transport protein ExbD